ncbi:MAG: MATE family efflux transporter [Holdemanella sp.]|nr:MATE family efflux transporter [Holdemanella sp.]
MEKRKYSSFYKEIFVLALPIAGQHLISQVLQLIDNIMVGSLGEDSISAVAINFTFTWLIMTFFMGFSSGSSVLCAQEYGRKNIAKMKALTATVIRINLVIAAIMFTVGTIFPSQILSLYTNQQGVVQKGVEYFSVIKYSIPVFAVNFALISMLQAAKNVKIGFINTTISCVVNAGLNYLLIYGKFGFPCLGVKGAAIATLVARLVELGIVLFYIFFMEKTLNFKVSDFFLRLDKESFKTLFKVSIPILVIEILSNLVSSVQTSITGHISPYYIAANSIVHTAWVIPSTLSFGISMASGVMIGNVIGEGDMEKVQAYAEKFVGFGVLFGIINSAVLTIILPIIMAQYNVTAETLDLAGKMGKLAIVTVFFISVASIVCNGVIKASGNTRTLLILDIVANWVIAIPLGYICAFVIKVPVHYLYLILRGGNIVKGVWGTYKVKTKSWMKA